MNNLLNYDRKRFVIPFGSNLLCSRLLNFFEIFNLKSKSIDYGVEIDFGNLRNRV